jgi:hypothetical protein
VSYCPGCDPIVCAGHVRCPTCGQAAWPSDAAWVGDDRVLAVYEAACSHLGDAAWIVGTGAEPTPDEWCKAIARSTGELCRQRARAGSGGYCSVHDPARRR